MLGRTTGAQNSVAGLGSYPNNELLFDVCHGTLLEFDLPFDDLEIATDGLQALRAEDYADGDAYNGNDTGVDELVSESHGDTHHHDHECCLEAASRMWNHP